MSFETGLKMTDSATKKIADLIEEEGDASLKLRIFVQGGGCSGFQYGFAFEQDAEVDDLVVEVSGVQLLVDPMSMQYLMGAEVDYVEDVMASQFVIRNPNAQSTCGCGSSFSV
jgi:iron-sulfur cluster insertion protein